MLHGTPSWLLRNAAILLLTTLAITGCKKDPMLIPDNEAPYYDEVPDVLINNYINRIYIDLIGREPLDTEMNAERAFLKENDQSVEARTEIIEKLQTDTSYVEGDISYKHAYYQRMYDMSKVRFLEGASDADINEILGPLYFGITVDSLNGNTIGMELKRDKIEHLENLLNCNDDYRMGTITINMVCARMIDNAIYDEINMNTFNFVNASFDNLFFRFPTQYEFYNGYDMIEHNTPGTIFGESGQNKDDYVNILTNSREFYEGMIVWTYRTLLARDPSTPETEELMNTFYYDGNYQEVQKQVMITDEYAHFE